MARVRYSFGSRHTGRIANIKKQRGKYPDVMREVIRISDIVLQVFDARFVGDMRNVEVDKMVCDNNAKTIYVLNKVDLVDVGKVERGLPVDLRPYVFVSVKSGKGIRELREKIMVEAGRIELKDGRTRVQVGVVGYPNAGKSSLINRLGRRKVAGISKQAGHTRGMQKIRLSKDILLLDTPGVIPDSKYTTDKRDRMSLDAKLGSRTYSNVKDPEDVVIYLMEDNARKIEKFYGIDAEGDSEKLIEDLGRKMNFLKKGGEVDVDRTARVILRDWQNGSIK